MTKVLLLDWPTDNYVVIVVETDASRDDVDAVIVPLLGGDGQPRDAVVGGWCDVKWADANRSGTFDTDEAVRVVRAHLRSLGPPPSGKGSAWALVNFGGAWALGSLGMTGPRAVRTEPVDLRSGPPKADLELE